MLDIGLLPRKAKAQKRDYGASGIGKVVECIRRDGNRFCKGTGKEFADE